MVLLKKKKSIYGINTEIKGKHSQIIYIVYTPETVIYVYECA